MALFNNNTKKPVTSFADQLANIKEVFRSAYSRAEALNKELDADITRKTSQIETLTNQLNDTKNTQAETQKFIKNLEKFI